MILTEEQAYLILKDKIEIHKSKQGFNAQSQDKNKRPEYYDGYNMVCDEYESIRVHSVAGVFPERLMGERSPNQTKEEYEYAKGNYQQTSNLPVFMDSVNTIQRSFNDGNWSIKYAKDVENDEDYEEYVTKDVPVYRSVENYIRYVLPGNKMRDAMGVTVIKPKIAYKKTSEDLMVEDDQTLRKPEILYYTSPCVWSNNDEDYFVIKTNEHTNLEDKKRGLVIWIVDEVNFFVFHQKKTEGDWYFELFDVIPHASESIPVKRLMGVPLVHENRLFWQSPFLFCVPALNSVVLDESYLQISKYKVGYPTRIIAANICDFTDNDGNNCIEGKLLLGTDKQKICPKCLGKGHLSRLSPQAEILVKPGTRENNYQGEDINNVIKYVSPDTEPMRMLREEINSNLKHARAIMHLKAEGEIEAGENVVESANKNKSLNAFIKPISDQMFDIYEWCLEIIGMQRYGSEYPKPIVISPQSFDFLTDEDYLVLIKQAQDASAPSFVIQSLIWKYLSAIFYTDLDAAKITSLIMQADRLITLPTNDINTGLINKTIEPWEKILHDSSINLVIDLQQTNDTFWKEATTDVMRKQMLIDLAKQRAADIKANTSTTPLIPAFTETV